MYRQVGYDAPKTNYALTVAFDLDVDSLKKGEKVSKITNIHFEDKEGDKKWITDNLTFEQVVYLNIEKAAPRLSNLKINEIPNLPSASANRPVTEQLSLLNIPGKPELVKLQAEPPISNPSVNGSKNDELSEVANFFIAR